jgi:hypothetical protein
MRIEKVNNGKLLSNFMTRWRYFKMRYPFDSKKHTPILVFHGKNSTSSCAFSLLTFLFFIQELLLKIRCVPLSLLIVLALSAIPPLPVPASLPVRFPYLRTSELLGRYYEQWVDDWRPEGNSQNNRSGLWSGNLLFP